MLRSPRETNRRSFFLRVVFPVVWNLQKKQDRLGFFIRLVTVDKFLRIFLCREFSDKKFCFGEGCEGKKGQPSQKSKSIRIRVESIFRYVVVISPFYFGIIIIGGVSKSIPIDVKFFQNYLLNAVGIDGVRKTEVFNFASLWYIFNRNSLIQDFSPF